MVLLIDFGILMSPDIPNIYYNEQEIFSVLPSVFFIPSIRYVLPSLFHLYSSLFLSILVLPSYILVPSYV